MRRWKKAPVLNENAVSLVKVAKTARCEDMAVVYAMEMTKGTY